MRLPWARAFCRGLWGGAQVTRSLWQRKGHPAWEETSSGATSSGDTSSGATSSGAKSSGDTFSGDTSSGDTFSGDTSGALTRKRLQRQRSQAEENRGGPEAFAAALTALEQSPGRRIGRLELVEAALAAMVPLGVAREREAYNRLLRLLPRGPWVPRGPIQRMLAPFPRQQECGLQILEQMERYGVVPDAETRFLLLGIFGPRSRPVRKCQRMLYWLPRMKHIDPYPLPPQLPPPGLAAARLGLSRIARDPDARVTVYQHPVPEEEEEEGGGEGSIQPYIIGAQSPEQQELLAQHGPCQPVYVEGPFPLWLRSTRLSYYVLRGDPQPPELQEKPPDPERSFYYPLDLELDLERGPWDDEEFDVDEVEEGPVFALCMAGAGDPQTLGKWISGLQETNPILGQTPVVFRLGGGDSDHPPTPSIPGGPQALQSPHSTSLEAGAPPGSTPGE